MINTHVVKFRLHFRKKCLLVYNKCILTVFKEIGEFVYHATFGIPVVGLDWTVAQLRTK